MTQKVAPARLLILGGTGEAADLAAAAVARFGQRLHVTTSLAGMTRAPRKGAGEIRSGGFGGAAGLGKYLSESNTRLVVDATHPFAAQISAAASAACAQAGIPRLILARPEWQPGPEDRWIEVNDAEAAAKEIPALGSRVFLTVGRRDLESFAALRGCWFLVRVVEMPDAPLPFSGNCDVIAARGPFTAESERKLMADHRIEVLVAKASGGAATKAKLEAARALRVPVVLLRRPQREAGDYVTGIEPAIGWIGRELNRLDGAPGPES